MMGYNDPMSTEPKDCPCGASPSLYQLPKGAGKFAGHWFVQCDECGLTGGVLVGAGLAVSFWDMDIERTIAPDNKRVVRATATAPASAAEGRE